MDMYKPEGLNRSTKCGFRENELVQAIERGAILEAPVFKSDENLTMHVDLGKKIYGLIPYEECEMTFDDKAIKSIAVISRVGKTVAFKVKEIRLDEAGNKYALLSRKEAQVDCKNNFINKLLPGQIIDAKVSHIERYGVFCDIGCGCVALLPIKNMCVTRIDLKHALKFVKNMKVVVKGVDETGKVTLSHKELLGTWEEEASKFNTGETVIGVVSSVEEYGVFVELTPNLSGLAEVNEGVKPGDRVTVLIKGFLLEQMKIRLLIINYEAEESEGRYSEFKYKISEGRVKVWRYSPKESPRVIETVFYED